MTDNELAIERLKDIKTKVESIGDSVALDIAISALKPTCKIDESNFSMEQYKTDLQSAYDCGKAEVLKDRWIPIEERLPKCCGVYYVTRLLGDGFEEQYITDASFFDGSNKWHDDNRINHDRDYLDDVVAWFEAEPYKKGE